MLSLTQKEISEDKERTCEIVSSELTLEKVCEKRMFFNIPIYQRLYVWSEVQINTLLEDLYKAFSENNNHSYYLGGIMLIRSSDQNDNKKTNDQSLINEFDLIDGQQRFTTLWLLSKELKQDLEAFVHGEIENKPMPRIRFSVRDFANKFFEANGQYANLAEDEKKELRPINDGLNNIKNTLKDLFSKNQGETKDLEKKKEEFAKFIFNKVQFIATQMPQGTDVNKVFEAMNNRGVQLQQHEILKSTLLKKIEDAKTRHKYALLWDACSIMDNYIEYNIKNVANLKWEQLFPDNNKEEKSAQLPEDILGRLNNAANNQEEKSLKVILTEAASDGLSEVKDNSPNEQDKDYDSGDVKSIISFPMLLLHVLRIFQLKYHKELPDSEIAEVNSKDLIKIFSKDIYKPYFDSEQKAKNFFDLLWEVRVNFDRFVIKWSFTEKEQEHEIRKLYRSETAFQRRAPESNDGFALLQSMLYHSQQITTHYWLTPLLHKALDCKNESKLDTFLQKVDNYMFCRERKEDLRVASFHVMNKDEQDLKGDANYVTKELESSHGTAFPSYWFYKLEYILWFNRNCEKYKNRDWDNYKMTAKNSVEHIYPQNEANQTEKKANWLDVEPDKEFNEKLNDFGNLVLLSVGMNSSYSDKSFGEKKAQFENRTREKGYPDPLKSDLIFEKGYWSWELCKEHREEMIKEFTNYL